MKKKQQDTGSDRIVEILKRMEEKKMRDELMWMKGDGVVANVTVTSSGITSLDLALGVGGYPHGRIVEVFGPNGAGKTSCTLHAIAEIQKGGGVAAFIDAEHSLDVSYAKRIGVDVDNLLISQPNSGEAALNLANILAQELRKGDIVVVDSVAALTPQAEIDGEIGDQFMGLQARMMSQAMRKLVSDVSKSGVILFFTNQTRSKLGISYGNPEVTCGGGALLFYASIRLDIRKRAQIKSGEDILGNVTEIKVVKNKCAPPYRVAETEIRYGEGVPKALDVLLLALKYNVIDKSGQWLSFNDVRLGQGKDNAYNFLKDNSETLSLLEKAVRERVGL